MTLLPERPWADGRYLPLAFLGRGTSGLVYRVRDRDHDVVLALKTLASLDPEGVYRLKQEFRACAGVRHRNLIELYELHVAADECFFTMELVDGIDLVRHVRRGADVQGAAFLMRFLSVARQLVDGLAVLHAAGRLHRDVKPPNALVDSRGRTVLLDFGFMVPFGERLLAMERSATVAGSLAYLAPEVLWGEPATPAADWYSVGVVFYEALSGGLPFTDSSAYLLAGSERPRPAPLGREVPPALAELVEALLAADPRARPDAQTVARTVESCSAEQWLAAAAPPSPLADEAPFVGRDRELQTMREALDGVRPNHTSVVRVCGASGIGKSELVRQFLATIERERDAVSLRGRCHPYETVPYRAFDGIVDALSRYLESLSDTLVASLAPRHTAAMVRLFPVLGRLPPFAEWLGGDDSEDAVELRRRGFAALRELLARLGDRRRLVLWIDDVQWADADSAALAREVFGGTDPPRLLLVLTYRSEDVGAAADFTAFDHAGGATSVTLGPLDDAAAVQLAEHVGKGRADNTAELVREAGGSPFFVVQLVRHALASESASSAPATASLSTVLQTRAVQLSDSSRRLLEVVSVAGRPIELRLAAAAGGLAGKGRHELITLQEERLLRLTTGGGHVEAYHDRIREAVVAGLHPGVLRERHRALAETLVREPTADAPALYRHFLGAGDTGSAASWAITAAELADRALAFAEAATFYRSAMELRDDADPDRHSLLVKRASALVNAGRGAEAAPLFIEAAGSGDRLGGLDLRRRAAEQYLQTGRLEEGVASMAALLADLGLAYPPSERRAVLGIVGGLGRVAVRGARTGAPRHPIAAFDRLRVEAARSAAKGLAMVDPLRGLHFAVRALTLALRSSDPYLASRELAGVGVTLLPIGPPFRAWASRMIHRSRALAESLDDAYLLAFTDIVTAQQRMVDGDWAQMLRHCDRGAAILRDRCHGVSWELAIAGAAAERALEELGRPLEILRRAEAALLEARERGDIVRTCSSIQTVGIAHLLQGRPHEARAAASRSREVWSRRSFQMQHFYALRLEAYAALAEDRPDEALRLLESQWAPLAASQLLRHILIGFDAHLLAARIHVAAARHATASRAQRLRRAAWHGRRVRRPGTAAALGYADTIGAGMALVDGDIATAIARLRAAAQRFASVDMRLAHADVRYLVGHLDPGNDGAGEIAAAQSAFADAGVTDVRCHMRLHGMWQ